MVAFLHDSGIVHRDLKPDNILLKSAMDYEKLEDLIRIADFGLVSFTDVSNMIDNSAGTPYFMAPEVLKGYGYSKQCDVWSVGIMGYMLLGGYVGKKYKDIFPLLMEQKFNFVDKNFSLISTNAKQLVGLMLQRNPAERITAKEALSHPWLSRDENDPKGILKFKRTITVLNMMKSYNAERRLKKCFILVVCVVHWSIISKKNN